MSYDIIYNKQFVRLRKTGEVIPMLLAGSSNCYEIGHNGRNGRRTRSWDSMGYYNRKGKVSEKPELILKKLDAELNRYIRQQRTREDGGKPSHVKGHFGYYAAIVVGSGHCADTSWNQYRSVFSNGIRNAKTIEELAGLGVYCHFSTYPIEGAPPAINIGTEREYFAELKKWREWRNNGGHSFSVSFSPSTTDRVLALLRGNRRRTPREKTRVEQDHYFVLNNPQSGNLIKYTSRGFRYSYSMTGGKQFRTEQEAEKYRQHLVKKGRYLADRWKVKRIDSNATFLV